MKKICFCTVLFLSLAQAPLRAGDGRVRFPHGFTAIEIPEETRFVGATGTLVEVLYVSGGSPAGRAGLAARDIIREVNGRPVRTLAELESVLRGPRPPKGGHTFSVFREGRRIRLVLSPWRKVTESFGVPSTLPDLELRKRTRISAFFPLVSRATTKNSDRYQIGAGVEVSYKINTRFTLHGGLTGYRESSGDPNIWGALHVGIDLQFIKSRVFYLFLRPSISLAYIRERGDRYDFDSVGLGPTLFTGFQIKLTEEADLGFFFGVSYIVLRDEGVGVNTYGEEETISPLYGGVYVRFDF